MESSCGTSKSAFDETDVVTLTLMEKRDNRSVPVQTIKIDPLSVDFYSPKITMKQFKMLAEDEISKRTEYCYMMCKVFPLFDLTQSDICQNTYRITSERTPEKISDSNYYSCWTCPEKIDYPQSFAEMEKFVKIMKYLQLFQYQSPSCKVNLSSKYQPIGSVELDNKTASSLPELNNNHYFVASFVDTKSQKSATIVLKDYKII